VTHDPAVVDLVREGRDELQDGRRQLLDYHERIDLLPTTFWDSLSSAKKRAVANADERMAKVCWCLEQIARAQDHFVGGFQQAKRDEFYGFWQALEQAELALHFLKRHYPISDKQFGLAHIASHTPRFQDLFPYMIFLSPGMVVEAAECSVCRAPITIRGGCGHEIGEVYRGEMCSRMITKVEMLEVSMVENPVQKYSVPFGPDVTYDYGGVRYVVLGLRSPWHPWSYTAAYPDAVNPPFPGAPEQLPCPCGGRLSYRNCCLQKARGRVHYEVVFSVKPPDGLPRFLKSASFRQRGNPPELAASSGERPPASDTSPESGG
jgi:hypothetical protein